MSGYYFAARFTRNAELRRYRDQLQHVIPGAVVTSRWIDLHGGDSPASTTEGLADPAAFWACGERDLGDITAADVVVSFTGGGGSGGRHVEYGYALGQGKRLVLVGAREHVFHCHPAVEVFDSWEEFLTKEQS